MVASQISSSAIPGRFIPDVNVRMRLTSGQAKLALGRGPAPVAEQLLGGLFTKGAPVAAAWALAMRLVV